MKSEMQPAPVVRREGGGRVELVRKLEVITPIFGGGVHIDAQQAHIKPIDAITPVRSASVRGQLRFWWRATHAHEFDTLSELRARETELWGGPSAPARVSLAVEGKASVQAVPVGGEGTKYAAFPLRADHGGQWGSLSLVRGILELRLRCDAAALSSVTRAVDAWLLFGGVGGRTRRGFGAVSPVELGEDELRAFIDPFKTARLGFGGLSSLAGAEVVLMPGKHDKASGALDAALNALRAFRQQPGFARNKGTRGPTPGRSRWPEPDTIRAITRQSAAGHETPLTSVRKFPRAAFGMPIIFHFRNERGALRQEPRDTHLLPAGAERRASPLVLRPVRIGEKFFAMALVLNDPARADEKLILRENNGGREHPVRSQLSEAEAREVEPLGGEPDPLRAFLRYFAKQS